ncbi:GPI-anchored protein LLG1-like [Lycium ferocissimum]|uniref:GPI-anchored protein LLG1-like n=1 Tax=Lycium ferocissimum TaxID=112874 RepID=UPI002815A4B5|nr:GPI-anchored protein LLG1-like [Lycium ferocissimum]
MAFERSCFFLFFFILAVGLASSSPTYISYDVLNVHMLGGRGLLENFLVKNDCPIDFEREDFSPLTGQCKGPNYNPLTCCNAFKQVACRYAKELNELENGCATGMFSIINKLYPLELFDKMCKEDKEGLACRPTTGPARNKQTGNAAAKSRGRN